MRHENFVDRMRAEVDRGAMNDRQLLDLLIQKAHFDAQRPAIERKFRNRVVGFVNGKRYVARTVQQVLAHAKQGKLVYFEPIGFNIFGG